LTLLRRRTRSGWFCESPHLSFARSTRVACRRPRRSQQSAQLECRPMGEVNRLDNKPSLGAGRPQVGRVARGDSGAISDAAQTNFYRFKAQKGQEFVFDVDAARRGFFAARFVAVRIGCPGQRAWAQRGWSWSGQPAVLRRRRMETMCWPLSDFRYRGGGNYSYRLTAGAIPYVESYFPFGGQRGKSVRSPCKATIWKGPAR